MRHLLTLVFLSSLTIPCFGLGATVAYDTLANRYFGSINTVMRCGDFRSDTTPGEIRLIKAYIYGGDMLFVDTIVFKNQGLEVLHGLSFKEINNDHLELDLEQVRCKYLANNQIELSASVNGTGNSDSIRYNFSIIYNANDNSYQYHKALKERSK